MVTTLSPDRLAAMLDGDESFTLVDTRPEESYESWHVPGAIHFPFGPEEELDGRLEEFEETVGDADRVVTICAKGISSGNLATQVVSATDDYEVNAVDGGMKGWSGVYEYAAVDVGGDLTVVQVQRRAKGCLGYVVGCESTGEAVVVDPTADVEEFVVAAEEAGLTIAGVIDTHIHADHVSGGRALADRLEVPYYMSDHAADRDVTVEFTPLAHLEVLAVGDREVKALYTPGHTSDMLSLLVDDRVLLTADTLHAESTGRTELEFSEEDSEAPRASDNASGETASNGEEGARMLYETLQRTILSQPEGVTVLPGHVPVTAEGEFDTGRPGEPITTTIRDARTGIDVLQLEEEEFVDRMADAGEKPANFEEVIETNRGVRDQPPEDRVELEMGPNNCSA